MLIYHNIKMLRQSRGWTQTELAERCGYNDKSMICKIEKGQMDIPVSKIHMFADLFNVSASDLMGWDDDEAILNSADEDKLLALFRQLNAEGRQNLLDHAELLAGSDRYIKSDMAEAEKIG